MPPSGRKSTYHPVRISQASSVCFLTKFGPKNELIQETGIRAVMKDSVYYVKIFSIKDLDVKFIVFGNLIVIFDFDYVGVNPDNGPGGASILASVFGYDLSALLSCLNARAWRHD
jgi:hypothetical protein